MPRSSRPKEADEAGREGRPQGRPRSGGLGRRVHVASAHRRTRDAQHGVDDGLTACHVLPGDIEGAPVRDRREKDGRSNGHGGRAVCCQQLRREVPLVMKHDDEGVIPRLEKHRVGAEGAIGGNARCACGGERGLDDRAFFIAEHAVLAGVRIEARHGDARMSDAEPLQYRVGRGDDGAHALLRSRARWHAAG